jgi:hypothetical protein
VEEVPLEVVWLEWPFVVVPLVVDEPSDVEVPFVSPCMTAMLSDNSNSIS